MTEQNKPWLDLAKQITATRRTYEQLAADCWRGLDVTAALRYRGMAEGLEMALNMVQQASQQAPAFVPARDNHGDQAWISADRTSMGFAHVDLIDRGSDLLYVLAKPARDESDEVAW
jgi:hypothetical protein